MVIAWIGRPAAAIERALQAALVPPRLHDARREGLDGDARLTDDGDGARPDVESDDMPACQKIVLCRSDAALHDLHEPAPPCVHQAPDDAAVLGLGIEAGVKPGILALRR